MGWIFPFAKGFGCFGGTRSSFWLRLFPSKPSIEVLSGQRRRRGGEHALGAWDAAALFLKPAESRGFVHSFFLEGCLVFSKQVKERNFLQVLWRCLYWDQFSCEEMALEDPASVVEIASKKAPRVTCWRAEVAKWFSSLFWWGIWRWKLPKNFFGVFSALGHETTGDCFRYWFKGLCLCLAHTTYWGVGPKFR